MSYYLLLAGKILMALIVAGLLLRGILLFISCERGYLLVDIRDAFRFSSVKKKGMLLFSFLLSISLLAALMVENGYQNDSLLVALTYPQASSGLNPNGSRYNMSDILCDEVLERALVKGGFGDITVEDLKSGLSVKPTSIVEQGDKDEDEGDEGELVSTQFCVEFQSNYKTGGLNGKEVVYVVAQAYRNWFIEQYSAKTDVLQISFDGIEEYDYPDLRSYFMTHLRKIINFSNSYSSKDSAYVSDMTGESFVSLNTKGWSIVSTGLERLNSYVLTYGLSKETENYMSRLRYEHINQCNAYLRDMQAYDVRIDAIRRYDDDMATVVYIPTYDMDNTFYMSKTKIGIDHFSMSADSYSNNASTELDSILDQKYLLQQLDQSPGSREHYKNADAMIEELENQILNLADVTRETVQDYENTTSNGYVIIAEEEENMAASVFVFVIVGFGMFILLYCNRVLAGLYRELKAREQTHRL